MMKSRLKPGAVIQSSSCTYQLQCILGSGVYGEVSLCRNLTSNKTVALKVLSGPYGQKSGRHEVKILRTLTSQGSQYFHIVQWLGSFETSGHFFHEFEKLDISLTQFLTKRPNGRLQVWETRPLICQMAEALEFLQHVGVMHCDLKPDNILMINHVEQPLRIKIIDFGLACSVNEVKQGKELQTLHYRAPETILRASVHVAIDMWSVGCIVAQMVLGHILFPATNEQEMMTFILETVGQPPKSCLDQGMLTSNYFCWSKFKQTWEYKVLNSVAPTWRWSKQLDHIFPVTANSSANHDRVIYLHLLKRMLDPNPKTRIRPEEVFQHPFIRMSHLEECEPAYFAQSVRLLNKTWRRKQLVNSTLTAQPSEAPPTTTASKGQGTNKRKAEEQESPSKKGRLDEDISEHSSNKARKSVSFPSKKIGTSTTSTCSSPDQHGIQGHCNHQVHQNHHSHQNPQWGNFILSAAIFYIAHCM